MARYYFSFEFLQLMTNTTAPTNFSDLGLISPLMARLTELENTNSQRLSSASCSKCVSRTRPNCRRKYRFGKTAAFAPLLQQIHEDAPLDRGRSGKGNYVSGLILVPTRELAKQVADSVKSYAVHFNGAIKTVCVFGGVSVNTQMQALRGG